MAFAPTNTETIVPQLPNEYKDTYTKDIAHLVEIAYKSQETMFNYESALPNRPMGTIVK